MMRANVTPIRAVVFDLDGLMFDTEALFYRVAGEMLAERGKRFTHEMMQLVLGRRAVEGLAALKTVAGLEEPVDELIAETRARFAALVDTAVHPTPGLFTLFAHLAEHPLPLAVATSSRLVYAEKMLQSHGLRDRFAFLLTAEDVSRGKPAPEIYLLAAQRFELEPAAMLVLEDSPPGVAAGKAAGAYTVGVPHDHSPADGLEAADLIIPRLDDPKLLALLIPAAARDRAPIERRSTK
jgi:beta-phosphoglucomutase-like phosphatase (HAD superfamily)